MKKGTTVQEHETRYDSRLISRGETDRARRGVRSSLRVNNAGWIFQA